MGGLRAILEVVLTMGRLFPLVLTAILAGPLSLAAAPEGALRGDPVDTSSGRFERHDDDFSLPGTPPIVFWRTYTSGERWEGPLGVNTTHAYELQLTLSDQGWSVVQLVLPDGARADYVRVAGTTHLDSVFEHHGTPTVYEGSRLVWNGTGWDIRFRDGAVYAFTACGPGSQCLLISQRDGQGRVLRVHRHGSRLVRIVAPDHRRIDFTTDTVGRITEARDHRGQVVRYQYDEAGRLVRVERTPPGFARCVWDAVRRRFAGGSASKADHEGLGGCVARLVAAWLGHGWGGIEVQEFGYDTRHRMVTIREPSWMSPAASFTNVYNDDGRVVAQLLGDGSRYEFAYTVGQGGRVTTTELTQRDGRRRRLEFDTAGYMTAETFALATAHEVRVEYERRPGGWVLVAHCPAALGGGELQATATRDQDRAAEALVWRCWKLPARPAP